MPERISHTHVSRSGLSLLGRLGVIKLHKENVKSLLEDSRRFDPFEQEIDFQIFPHTRANIFFFLSRLALFRMALRRLVLRVVVSFYGGGGRFTDHMYTHLD